MNKSKECVPEQKQIATRPEVIPFYIKEQIPVIGESGEEEPWDTECKEIDEPPKVSKILEHVVEIWEWLFLLFLLNFVHITSELIVIVPVIVLQNFLIVDHPLLFVRDEVRSASYFQVLLQSDIADPRQNV